MAGVTRAIDTPRGALLVSVRRVTDVVSCTVDAEDLRRAARALLAEAAVLAKTQPTGTDGWVQTGPGSRRKE